MIFNLYKYIYIRFSKVWYEFQKMDGFNTSTLGTYSFITAIFMSIFLANNIYFLVRLNFDSQYGIAIIILGISFVGHWFFLFRNREAISIKAYETIELKKDVISIVYISTSILLLYFYWYGWFAKST